MFTKIFFRSLYYSLKLSNYFNIPIGMKKNSNRLHFISHESWIKFKISYIFTLIFFSSLIPYQIYYFWRIGNVGERSIATVALCVGILLLVTNFPIAYCPQEMIQSYNSSTAYILRLTEYLIVDYKPEDIRAFDSLFILLAAPFVIASYILPTMLTIQGALTPTMGGLLTSLFPPYLLQYKIIILITTMIHFHFFNYNIAFISVHVQLILASAMTLIPFGLNELRSDKKKYLYKSDLRTVEMFPQIYRGLQLFMKEMLYIYGPMLIPCQIAVGNMIIFIAYTLINARNNNKLHLSSTILLCIGGGACLAFETSVLGIGAKLFVNIKRTLREWRPGWKTVEEARYIRRLKRSFRPLAIEMPGYFKITNLTMLKFLKAVLRGTLRALLTLK